MAAKKKTAKKDPVLDSRPIKSTDECDRCTLCNSSETICCPTRGPKKPKIVLFGEALGQTEEQQGRAFVGDAGRKLGYALGHAKLKRKKLGIGNVCRCRPPKNRTPSKKELTACAPYTLYDILKLQPKVIVALGATAWRALLPHHATDRLDKWRGFPEKYTFSYTTPKGKLFSHTCWVVGTFHPSACLRNWELDDLLIHDLKIAKAYAADKIVLKTPDTKVHVCESIADVRAFAKKVLRRGSAVVDLETTGTDPHKHKIRCVGFCYRKGEAWIIPLMKKGGLEFWTRAEKSIVLRILRKLMLKLKIVGQGIKFDVQMLRKLLGLIDYNIIFDTMCGAHVLDENKPTNLTFLTQWFLRWTKYDAVIARYKTDEDGIEGAYRNAPDELLWTYCGYDVDGTFQLWGLFEPLIKTHGVKIPFATELGLILPLADVEFRGLHVDRKKLIKAADGYRKALKKTRASLVKTCVRVFKKRNLKRYCAAAKVKEFDPAEFNPNAADMVAPLLLAAGATLRKKTPTGKYSTDKLVLGYLALRKNTAGSIARRMRLMRSLTKWKSTYFDGNDEKPDVNAILGMVTDYDRCHTNYFITAARTGRLSAKDPPLQTVPRVDPASALGYPVSKEIAALVKPRYIYVPDVPGEHILLEVDYAKVELCTMAWLASDRVMLPELLPGAPRDLHTNMAITATLLRNPTDAEYKKLAKTITKNARAVAKGVNFGIPYGRGAAAIAEANPGSFPLDLPVKKRKEQVQRVVDAWLDKYEDISCWREEQIDAIRRQGYLRDWLGRRRLLTGIRWYRSPWAEDCLHTEHDQAHMEREAMNYPIQALATGLHNRATRKCYEGIKTVKIPALRIVMTLHDSLIFNVHKDYVEEATHHIRGWMELTLPKQKSKGRRYEMPLKVDATPCNYWGEHDG